MRPARPLALLSLCLGLLACASFEEDRSGAAQDVVRRFFTALPSGDCARLGPLLAGPEPGACEAASAWHEQGLSLVRVLDVKADGRDANAMLVRARVARQGRERAEPLLLRVERHADGWKLRL